MAARGDEFCYYCSCFRYVSTHAYDFSLCSSDLRRYLIHRYFRTPYHFHRDNRTKTEKVPGNSEPVGNHSARRDYIFSAHVCFSIVAFVLPVSRSGALIRDTSDPGVLIQCVYLFRYKSNFYQECGFFPLIGRAPSNRR